MCIYRLLADVSCGQYSTNTMALGRVNRNIEVMLSSSGAGEESDEGKLAELV